ncbi:hypothetical protein [Gracilimonas tropica]|uniref:hypothetical protein n=1 Tax=Gracilimonas tropica TaxID=454600 RepID=UPI00037DCC51|nr:hypothetical protein [Gracilimonas tropica]
MKTNVSNSQLKGMKSTNIPLRVGSHKGGLDLWVRMKIDGETVSEFPGHSFVSQFAYDLHALMHGGEAERQVALIGYNLNNNYKIIDAASNASPIRIGVLVFSQALNNTQNGDLVWVYGVRGNTAANGLRVAQNVGANGDFDLYELDGVTPVVGNGAYSGGGAFNAIGKRNWSFNRGGNHSAPVNQAEFGYWELVVGTDNDPVSINDFGLHNRCAPGNNEGELTPSGRSITAQTTDKPSSKFSILTSYTNNSGASIDVAEIGLTRCVRNVTNEGYQSLIARDVLDVPLSLPVGKTLSVEYEVITELQPDTQDTDLDGTNGGFTERFLNRMRIMASNSPQDGYMNFLNVAGPSAELSSNERSNRKGWELGIRLGTDNTYVSTTNTELIAQIDHSKDGLYYYGSNVEDVIIDEANNKATFEVNRIFENRSAAPITIKEVGLFGNNSGEAQFNGVYMYARTALAPADQFTIQPGEFRIVRYTLEFIA